MSRRNIQHYVGRIEAGFLDSIRGNFYVQAVWLNSKSTHDQAVKPMFYYGLERPFIECTCGPQPLYVAWEDYPEDFVFEVPLSFLSKRLGLNESTDTLFGYLLAYYGLGVDRWDYGENERKAAHCLRTRPPSPDVVGFTATIRRSRDGGRYETILSVRFTK